MILYNEKGQGVDLTTKDYVDGKTEIHRNVNLGVGSHTVNLKNVKCLVLYLKAKSGAMKSFTFLSTGYYMLDGITITVNFEHNLIKVDALPSGFTVSDYLLVY